NVVLRKNTLNGLQPRLDHSAIVRCAVLAEEVFQNVGRYYRVLLQAIRQILTHNKTGEMQEDLLVEVAQLALRGDDRFHLKRHRFRAHRNHSQKVSEVSGYGFYMSRFDWCLAASPLA